MFLVFICLIFRRNTMKKTLVSVVALTAFAISSAASSSHSPGSPPTIESLQAAAKSAPQSSTQAAAMKDRGADWIIIVSAEQVQKLHVIGSGKEKAGRSDWDFTGLFVKSFSPDPSDVVRRDDGLMRVNKDTAAKSQIAVTMQRDPSWRYALAQQNYGKLLALGAAHDDKKAGSFRFGNHASGQQMPSGLIVAGASNIGKSDGGISNYTM
jgi:hypothetical protein